NRQSERAREHDVAGGDLSALPECDRPRQQADGQYHRDQGMQNAHPLEVEQAVAARAHFVMDRTIESPMLVAEPAECPHQRRVAADATPRPAASARVAG